MGCGRELGALLPAHVPKLSGRKRTSARALVPSQVSGAELPLTLVPAFLEVG